MRVFYCDCGQKMRVSESTLGRSGHCPRCRKIVTVTMENTAAEPLAPPIPDAPASPQQEDMLVPAAGVDASDPPSLEELLEEEAPNAAMSAPQAGLAAPAPPPPPPPPPRRPAAAQRAYVEARMAAAQPNAFDTLLRGLNAGLDWRKCLLACAALLVWFLVALLLGGIMIMNIPAGIVLLAIWCGAAQGVVQGGLSHMCCAELRERRTQSLMETFAFIGRRILDLCVAIMGAAVVVVVFLAIINTAFAYVSAIQTIGPILAALLLIPVFVFNLLGILLLFSLLMVPCIIAADDCGILPALRRLVRLLLRQGGYYISLNAASFGLAFSVFGFAAALVSCSLMLTFMGASGAAASAFSSSHGMSYGGPDFFSGGDGGGGVMIIGGLLVAVLSIFFLGMFVSLFAGCSTAVYLSCAKEDEPLNAGKF